MNLSKHQQKILSNIEAECTNAGLRLTAKRHRVLTILVAATSPMSAYDLISNYEAVYDDDLSAMSAYRMLDFFTEAEFIHKLSTTNQYLICSHLTCDHEHEVPQFLICDSCHDVQEIGIRKALQSELESSIEKSGFRLNSPQLELHGLCANCSSA